MAFRGHDEFDDLRNQGNFLELLRFLANHNNDINNVVLENAPKNLQVTAHDIQREPVHAVASATTRAIIHVLGDDLFFILIDESCDVSVKEQMAILLRCVNEEVSIIERFLKIVRINDTAALSLKIAIMPLFLKHGLRLSKLCSQDYDETQGRSQELQLRWAKNFKNLMYE